MERLRRLQLPPWPLYPLAEMPLPYRVWVCMLSATGAVATVATWVLSGASMYVGDGVYLVCAVVAVALLQQASLRHSEHRAFPYVQVAAFGLVLAGRPAVAVICIAVTFVVSAIRKPLVPHLVVVNIVNSIWSITLSTVIFGQLAGSAALLSGSWLAAAAAAFVPLLVMDFLANEVTSALGGYSELSESLRNAPREALWSVVSITPPAIVLGVALAQPERWYLLALVLPFMTSYDIYSRSEQLVQSMLRNRYLRDTFSGYMPERVVNQLLDAELEIELGGEQREITVLFCDIRNFTSWSEHLEPAAVVEHLNQLLTALTDCVFITDGTLDKFTGDGLMAFWGAPLSQEDHALRGLQTARMMTDRLAQLNFASGTHATAFRLGIGIHTGQAIVGNIGHDRRHDYTAIGDTVNVSARLESATKEFGVQMLVSSTTIEALPEQAQTTFDSVGSIMLKGRGQPIEAFKLADEAAASHAA